MRISVFGCGYLGAVHAACMASLGHEVVGIDVIEEQIAALAAGRAAVPRARSATSCSPRRWPPGGWSSPPTPRAPRTPSCTSSAWGRRRSATRTPPTSPTSAPRSTASCRCSSRATSWSASPPCRWAPPRRLADRIEEREPAAELVWNPEFLREGHAVEDTLHPDRLVYGFRPGEGGDASRAASWTRCTPPRWPTAPRKIETDLATAQLVKVAANSFLATKISFINAMAELCEATGADVTQLADAIGHDDADRPASSSTPGSGFGGGCLPKDIRAFMARAGELGADQALSFLREVDSINMRRRVRMVDLAREVCGGSIVGRRIARARRGVQAAQRRHPRLARALRGRADAAPGRPGHGHRPEGDRQRPEEVARAGLRRHRRGGRTRRRGRAAADRVAGVRRPRPGRAEGAGRRAADHRRPQLPRPGHLARRRLDLPRAGPP